MKAISIRELVIGDGTPKICVPVSGETKEEILAQAEQAVREGPDLLEWRADSFAQVGDPDAWQDIPVAIRDLAGPLPVLFTLRTVPEGGAFPAETEKYLAVMARAIAHSEIDLIDIEGLREEMDPGLLVARAFLEGKTTIASAHFFDRTPSTEEMMSVLDRLDGTGADILKLAVMPEDQADALALMRVTSDYLRTSRTPLITMAMGEAGIITRTTGRLTGSAVTFGAAGCRTAPGQLPVRELRELLHKI